MEHAQKHGASAIRGQGPSCRAGAPAGGLQRSVLGLQAAAGNRAVSALLGIGAATAPPLRSLAPTARELGLSRATELLSSGPAHARTQGEDLPVQRHSSWEHKLLGDANPETLAQMGSWQDLIAQTGPKRQGTAVVAIGGIAQPIDKGQVMHVLVQEMARLKEWQDAPPTSASTDDTLKVTQKDPKFEVVIVRLPAADPKDALLITYGEMNTLADFYGDLETMKTANPKHRRQIVQSVRKETFLRLKEIYDNLTKSLTAQEKSSGNVRSAKEAFSAAKLGKAKFAGAAKPDFISGVSGQADLLAGDKPLIGQGTGARGDTNKYGATLARNACHFVPESWHAWAEYHDQGRRLAQESWDLFNEASRLQTAFDLTDYSRAPLDRADAQSEIAMKKKRSANKANEALLANGFGDHYLQDSYASGHMINKTQIMQWYVQFIDKSNEWDYFKDKNWRRVQQMAYRQNLSDPGQYDKANVKGATANNQNVSAPRNPQSVESGVAGDWTKRFEALGLQVPGTLRTPGSDTRKVLEWWQLGIVSSLRGRELTGAQFGAAPVTGGALQTALIALIRDGVVRTSEDVTTRGGYMGATDQQIQGARFTNFATTKLLLREDYIPIGKAKKQKFLAALAESKGGVGKAPDDSSYQKMAASVTYGDYLEFMKSGFLQKATNALHDTFCAEGLSVSSSAGGEVFKVYGDDRMLNAESSKGVIHSGTTANMSRDSIMNVINTGSDQGTTAMSILNRLPSHVQFDVRDGNGAVASVKEDIQTWHNSSQAGRLHSLCDTQVFPKMSWSLMQKMVPGVGGAELGKISKDEGVHGADAF